MYTDVSCNCNIQTSQPLYLALAAALQSTYDCYTPQQQQFQLPKHPFSSFIPTKQNKRPTFPINRHCPFIEHNGLRLSVATKRTRTTISDVCANVSSSTHFTLASPSTLDTSVVWHLARTPPDDKTHSKMSKQATLSILSFSTFNYFLPSPSSILRPLNSSLRRVFDHSEASFSVLRTTRQKVTHNVYGCRENVVAVSHQCQLFTFVASARSSTIQRGSPWPHFAIESESAVYV